MAHKSELKTCLKTGFQREIAAVSLEISRSKEFSNTPEDVFENWIPARNCGGFIRNFTL
jgi:hypothetical protein